MPPSLTSFLALILGMVENEPQASNRGQMAAPTLPTQSSGSNHINTHPMLTSDLSPFETEPPRDSSAELKDDLESNGDLKLALMLSSESLIQYRRPCHIVYVKILACLLEVEEDIFEPALTLLALSNNMVQQTINSMEAAKRLVDSSVQRYMDDINHAVGGSPSDNASREDWDRYLDAFMNEKQRRDAEDDKNSWPQLTKASQYVERMKQQAQPARNHGEEHGLLRTIGYTVAGRHEDKTERRQTTKKNPKERPRKDKRAEEDKQQASLMDNQAGKGRGTQALANGSLSSSADAPRGSMSTTPPIHPAHTSEGEHTKKRRRTGAEILESDLGKNWEPHVDSYGHRPARRVKKSQ
ncbi:hypothetical protein F5Y06DRAFT_1452 [Hypoxylon sp. FL0890]|nr:hypothetical protein F5Y06DRAFT_1452 [Hypoxylon sp. FL0890]